MHFPGNRTPQHYFPVEERAMRRLGHSDEEVAGAYYVVGLDQLIVDIEVRCGRDLLDRFQIPHGESVVLADDAYALLSEFITTNQLVKSVTAGGAVGNTLNNYTFLSGEKAYMLGTIDNTIAPGSFAFRYVNDTPRAVSLDNCLPVDGHLATAITFVTPDGERSFALNIGAANDYPPEAIPAALVERAAAVLLTAFCLRDEEAPIAHAALRLMEIAEAAGVPVIFSMGTAALVRDKRERFIEILEQYVTCAAMNIEEGHALTGESAALLACQRALDWVDMAVVTEGSRGLTMGGYVDEDLKRPTRERVHSKEIKDYNAYEYSRLMRRSDCANPLRIYSHIHPYMGGPERVVNTSGAGDAAIAALLHDLAANRYHRGRLPSHEKHRADFLTYSSLARNAQYGNRIAYQVLLTATPRLDGSLPDDAPPAISALGTT